MTNPGQGKGGTEDLEGGPKDGLTQYSPAQLRVGDAVTALFVPGNRPDRFAKAASTPADVVLLDLEDAVGPADKADARAEVISALSPGMGLHAVVRINAAGTSHFADDVRALWKLAQNEGHGLLGVMVSKAEDPDTIRELGLFTQRFGLALVPLIESAVGLLSAEELAKTTGVTRLAFGAIDFALDVDASLDDRFLDHARSVLVVASRAAGIRAPLDSPSTEIRAMEHVRDSAVLARSFGFGGKLCIHPGQISGVNAAFTPSLHDIAWAENVVSGDGAVLQLQGQMIDRPVIERANRILKRASQMQ